MAPAGLVYDVKHDLLYLASTDDNAVFAVPQASTRQSDAGRGQLIYQDQTHLHGALAMAFASNNDLLVSNSDLINPDPNQPSEIVEFTTARPVRKGTADGPEPRRFFRTECKCIGGRPDRARFAAVDDDRNTLNIWTLPAQ